MPGLWEHPAVTHQERKDILRCLIDHIVVVATKEKIEATIFWKAGGQTPLIIWRGNGRLNLIRELHAQQLTASEIKEHLAAGKTSNGQVVNIGLDRLNHKLHVMGLKANRFSAGYLSIRQEAAKLYRDGRSAEWIARHFNKKGYGSASGRRWTALMVYGQLRAMGVKAESLDDIHYRVIADARARGLSYEEMAIEFNKKKIRRLGFHAWTPCNVRQRWTNLSGQKNNTEQQESSAEVSGPSDLKRSA